MYNQQSFYRFVGLVVVVALVIATPVSGQCMVDNIMYMTTSLGMIMTVQVQLNGMYNIGYVSGNASLCAPGAPMQETMLTASAYSTYVAPFCRWSCIGTNCGTCDSSTLFVDSSDGLPVELMEFGVAAEETLSAPSNTGLETDRDSRQ